MCWPYQSLVLESNFYRNFNLKQHEHRYNCLHILILFFHNKEKNKCIKTIHSKNKDPVWAPVIHDVCSRGRCSLSIIEEMLNHWNVLLDWRSHDLSCAAQLPSLCTESCHSLDSGPSMNGGKNAGSQERNITKGCNILP